MDAVDFLKYFGLGVCSLGGLIATGATLFGTVDSASWFIASLRGFFQLREHYTESGWRFYRTGVALALTGLLLLVTGLLLRPGF